MMYSPQARDGRRSAPAFRRPGNSRRAGLGRSAETRAKLWQEFVVGADHLREIGNKTANPGTAGRTSRGGVGWDLSSRALLAAHYKPSRGRAGPPPAGTLNFSAGPTVSAT